MDRDFARCRAADPRAELYDQEPAELEAFLVAAGEPRFRADQTLSWVYRRLAPAFDACTDLPAATRARLHDAFTLDSVVEAHAAASPQTRTTKLLYRLRDGETIESVFLDDDGRVTYCISSQVGCAVDCRFCATGWSGFSRNLTAGEIVAQVVGLARRLGPPDNIVYMGMGEPFLNLDAVIRSVRALTDPRRLGLSPRRITLSTSGIIPGIDRIAEPDVPPVRLAVSLSGTNEETRTRVMPINERYPLADLLAALRRYVKATGRLVTFEYVLIPGVNIGPTDARELARIARGLAAKVNLIALNPVEESGFRSPTASEEQGFRDALRALGVRATIRFRRGRDIAAACGQLRRARAPSLA
jgi:23S rRNA (adenine2503-C2)-methyltransferase